MKKIIVAAVFLIAISGATHAQPGNHNTKWMEYLEEMSEDEEYEASAEDLFNELSYLAEHPFDLHSVTREDLERLPFLSAVQIENILYYIYRHSPILSIYELKNVKNLDMQTIEYLLPFVRLNQEEPKTEPLNAQRVMRYAKQELLLRYDRCFQQKAGYRDDSEEEKEAHPSRYYMGEPFYTSLKYNLQYKERLQLGFVAEKDAGEPFWNERHKGFDYYSAHVALRNFGAMKQLIVGDYRLSFGQGLVVNTGFNLANTSDVMNVGRKANDITRHFSTSEANHLRGVAATFGAGKTNLSVFCSQRSIDASVDDSTIFSVKTDGYRRTVNDLLKKDRAKARLAGGNIQWRNDFLSLGMTALYHDYGGRKLDPEEKPYNIFYLRDTYNYNVGVDYSYRRKNMVFQGETAVSGNGAVAFLHTLQVYPSSSFGFVLRQRSFAKDYQAQYASVAGTTLVQNANAWYLGCTLEPFAFWKVSASVEFIEYPWLKYLIDSPSRAAYALWSVDYSPKENLKMNLRYTYRERMKNFDRPPQATKVVLPSDQHALRYQLNWTHRSGFYAKWQASGKYHVEPGAPVSKGWMLSQNGGYTSSKLPLQGDLFFGYFHTDDWDSRISTYEKSILHAFSVPSFSGEGLRSCFTLRWGVLPWLTFYTKFAWTHYVDRSEVGSGLEAIEGRDKMDFYGLVRIKL